MLSKLSVCLIVLCIYLQSATASRHDVQIIHKDVCIIGGGSSGTHAAINLQRQGKSIALIERKERLGGHVETYHDTATGISFDYGTIIFSNTSATREYFEYLNISLIFRPTAKDAMPPSVDFRTGKRLEGGDLINNAKVTDALKRYDKILEKYSSIDSRWLIPSPVPEDFIITWGEFLAKHNLRALGYVSFFWNQGYGNILSQPALFILRYFDREQVRNYLGNGWVTSANGQNQILYNKAAERLSDGLFLNSNITEIKRSPKSVTVRFNTPSGPKIIKSSKLLIAIPPILSNLQFLDLTPTEHNLFAQFNHSYFWVSLLRNTNLPSKGELANVYPEAPYMIPPLPTTNLFAGIGFSNLTLAYYNSPTYRSDEEVKADMLAAAARVANSKTEGKVEAFADHAPFGLTVSKDAILGGFYAKLEALQGCGNTWWTGSAWNRPVSSSLWEYNMKEIIPQLV